MAERYPDLPPVYHHRGRGELRGRRGPRQSRQPAIIPDERRLRYLADHIGTALDATAPGGAAERVDLRGYYVWSFMDNFEWSGGYKQPFGLVHVDFETQVRTPKASYYWFQELQEERKLAAAADAAVAAAAAGPDGTVTDGMLTDVGMSDGGTSDGGTVT